MLNPEFSLSRVAATFPPRVTTVMSISGPAPSDIISKAFNPKQPVPAPTLQRKNAPSYVLHNWSFAVFTSRVLSLCPPRCPPQGHEGILVSTTSCSIRPPRCPTWAEVHSKINCCRPFDPGKSPLSLPKVDRLPRPRRPFYRSPNDWSRPTIGSLNRQRSFPFEKGSANAVLNAARSSVLHFVQHSWWREQMKRTDVQICGKSVVSCYLYDFKEIYASIRLASRFFVEAGLVVEARRMSAARGLDGHGPRVGVGRDYFFPISRNVCRNYLRLIHRNGFATHGALHSTIVSPHTYAFLFPVRYCTSDSFIFCQATIDSRKNPYMRRTAT